MAQELALTLGVVETQPFNSGKTFTAFALGVIGKTTFPKGGMLGKYTSTHLNRDQLA